MDLSAYFHPITIDFVTNNISDYKETIGTNIQIYREKGEFPTLEDVSLAMVGICDDGINGENERCKDGPDEIRRYFYRLAIPAKQFRMVDLGNIVPTEESREEFQYHVTEAIYKILEKNITLIILGGGQHLTLYNYKAYEVLGRVINIASIDPRFDLGGGKEVTSSNWLSQVVQQQPNYLYYYFNLGYQTYFCGESMVRLMDELNFDAYRLGVIQNDMERAETLVRSADMVSVDISSVRLSDAPGQSEGSPHGFYGEELCQLVRFAGLSDKLSSIGFYDYNPLYDRRGQTAHLIAHAIWYFVEGFFSRMSDFPYRDKQNYNHFLVPLDLGVEVEGSTIEISFYKSKKSNRWWIEIPNRGERCEQYQRHSLVPCTYDDYLQATRGEVPHLWQKYFMRMN